MSELFEVLKDAIREVLPDDVPMPDIDTPEEWAARGHPISEKLVAVVLYEGTDAGRWFDYDYCAPDGGPPEAYQPIEDMIAALDRLSVYSECAYRTAPIYRID